MNILVGAVSMLMASDFKMDVNFMTNHVLLYALFAEVFEILLQSSTNMTLINYQALQLVTET